MNLAGTTESHSAVDAIVGVEQPFDIGEWQDSIRAHCPRGDVNAGVIREVAEELARLPNVQATLGFLREGKMPLVPATSMICHPTSQDHVGEWQPFIEPTIRSMCKAGQGFARMPIGEGIELLVASVGPKHHPFAVLCAFVDVLREAPSVADMGLRIVAAEMELWFGIQNNQVESQGNLTANILWQACQGRTMEESCFKLASRLSEALKDQMVFVGSRPSRKECRLYGISGIPEFVRDSQLAQTAEAVMCEAVIRKELRRVSPAKTSVELTAAEIELFELSGVNQLISGPLRGAGNDIVGAWIVCVRQRANPVESDSPEGTDWLTVVEQLESVAGIALDAVRRFQPNRTRAIWNRYFSNGGRNNLKKLLMLGVVIMACLMVPMPYRVYCNSSLQPATRRVVSAPYDGILDEVMVRSGDSVSPGQILARMDGREIQWQLAAAQASMKRFGKEHDSAMARGDTAAAQVAELQMKSNQAESQLLTNRLKNLEIRSTISGVVIGGDPEQMLGARLSVGQQLFETSPLDQMLIDVLIPEAEVRYVEEGDYVSLRLDSFPHKKFGGQIRRISPQAELRESENVFVAEVLLDNERSLLRPGMAGQSRISTGRRMLGWILFHRAFDQLRFWMGL